MDFRAIETDSEVIQRVKPNRKSAQINHVGRFA
jgi:hypothetical protein